MSRRPSGVERFPVAGSRLPADRVKIDRLAADHARRAGGLGDQRDHAQLPRHQRRVEPLRLARQQAERLGLQAVAGENRHALAVHDVRRRPPAPQIVVVHRRQIVVNQRIGVDHLDRARRRHRRVARRGFGRADRLRHAFGAREHQQRAQPLAAAEQAVAHRVGDDRRRRRRGVERKASSARLDFLAARVEILVEGH